MRKNVTWKEIMHLWYNIYLVICNPYTRILNKFNLLDIFRRQVKLRWTTYSNSFFALDNSRQKVFYTTYWLEKRKKRRKLEFNNCNIVLYPVLSKQHFFAHEKWNYTHALEIEHKQQGTLFVIIGQYKNQIISIP